MLRNLSDKEKKIVALCKVTLDDNIMSKAERFKIRCYMLSIINGTYFNEKETIDSILGIFAEG